MLLAHGAGDGGSAATRCSPLGLELPVPPLRAVSIFILLCLFIVLTLRIDMTEARNIKAKITNSVSTLIILQVWHV